MKHILILMFCYNVFSIQAQNYCTTIKVPTDNSLPACCNGNINTDYNFPFNPERIDLTNQFNWLKPPTSSAGQSVIEINRNNSVIPIEHPFLNDLTKYYWYSNYRLGDQAPYLNNNMHPKYGWQLLYHNLGLNLFTQNPATSVPQVFNPTMIYYNKHTGKMRIFSSPGQGNSFDESTIKMGFAGITNGLKPSGLLSHNAPIAKALDQKTEVSQITAGMPFANMNTWSGADIQTAYDPCICNNESRLQFNYFDQDFSSVYMTGNIVGINSPLDNSGNTPLQFNKNFISSVYADFSNQSTSTSVTPSSGMLVYNQIDQIVANSYVSPEMKLLSDALNLIGGIDKITGIEIGVKNLGLPFGINGLPIGKAIGKGLTWASKELNPSAPQITFLEATGAFSGQINDISNSGGYGSFEILNPGSFHNFRKTNPWTIEPLYNESLGLFALLETPSISYCSAIADGAGDMFSFALDNPLKFVLNPSADIDLTQTKISAAIEFDFLQPKSRYIIGTPSYYNGTSASIPASEVLKPDFMQLSPDALIDYSYVGSTNNQPFAVPNSEKWIFSSYILPINKLHNVSFRSPKLNFTGGNFNFIAGGGNYSTKDNEKWTPLTRSKPRLRIYVDYVFKANAYGEINKTSQTYVYDIDHNYEGYDFSVNSNGDGDSGDDGNDGDGDSGDGDNDGGDGDGSGSGSGGGNSGGSSGGSGGGSPGSSSTAGFNFMNGWPNTCNCLSKSIKDKPYISQLIGPNATLNTNNYTTSTTLYFNNLYIIGNLSTTNGAKLIIYYRGSVKINPNSQISPDITIVYNNFDEHDGLTMPDEAYLKNTFCKYGYQANQLKSTLISKQYVKELKPSIIKQISLFPNPTTANTTLELTNYDKSIVHIRVYDLIGREVWSRVEKDIKSLNHRVEIESSKLEKGIYLVNIDNGVEKKSIKLEVR